MKIVEKPALNSSAWTTIPGRGRPQIAGSDHQNDVSASYFHWSQSIVLSSRSSSSAFLRMLSHQLRLATQLSQHFRITQIRYPVLHRAKSTSAQLRSFLGCARKSG